METTLNLDPDVADLLEQRVKENAASKDDIANMALRTGLKQLAPGEFCSGLRPGIDRNKMGQLFDELFVDDYLEKAARDRAGR
jgi:hypothetical protein